MAEKFSAAEKAAMKERAAEAKASKKAEEAEADVLAKIAEMPDADRTLAEKVHALVKEHAPELQAKTWYGQPAYARDGKVVCFLQVSSKFGLRYSTLGFNEDAHLDDGNLWPTAFAITKLGAAEEEQVIALLRKAVG